MDLYQGYEGDSEVGAPEDKVFSNLEDFNEYKASVEHVIAQAKSASRLADNKDFQDIIMRAYMQDEPVRLAGLIASGRVSESVIDDCVVDLKSIGNLNSFLSQFIAKGNIAVEELAGLEEARAAAIAEAEGE
jgi:hypothetical protein